MSGFVFYKPNSNPSRFSRKERFSLHLTSASAPYNTCQMRGGDCLSSNEIAASDNSSSFSPNFACDENACGRPYRYGSHCTSVLSPDMSGVQHDKLNSLASLCLPSDKNERCSLDAPEQGIHLPAGLYLPNETDSLGHSNPKEIPSAKNAVLTPGEGYPSPTGRKFSPRENPGSQKGSAIAHNSEEEQPIMQDPLQRPPSCGSPLSPPSAGLHEICLARDFQESTGTNTKNLNVSSGSDIDIQHAFEPCEALSNANDIMQLDIPADRALGDSESIEPMQNLAADVMTSAELDIGTENILPEEQNLVLGNGRVSSGTPFEGLSEMNDAVSLSEQPPEGHQFIGSRSIACQEATVEPQSLSSCRETDSVYIPRPDQDRCSTPSIHENLEDTVVHNKETPAWEHAETAMPPCYSIDKGLDSDANQLITSPPNHAQPIRGQMSTPTSHSPSSIKQRTKPVEFSHVEIRNLREPDTNSGLEESVPRCAGADFENTNTNSSSNTCCPWRLSGTTLSIDILEAERIPIFVGYSTFRVVDDQLFQTVTLSQGNVKLAPATRPVHIPARREYHPGNGKKTGQMRLPSNRGSLSSDEKRKLVRLRDDQYTWNEIAIQFPHRKKGTLQKIYYTQLKDSRDRASPVHGHSRRYRPACNSLSSRVRGSSQRTGERSAYGTQSLPTSHPRYSFRARRGPRS